MLTPIFIKTLLVILAIPATISAAPTLPSGEHENIVGGTLAQTNEFPFVVSVQRDGSHTCGGVLVNADTVITAAHCTFKEKASTFSVRAGSTRKAAGGVVVPVHKVIMTPGFSPKNMKNDIAILKLYVSIHLSPSIAYATLARKGFKPRPGTVLTAAGWGSINASRITLPAQLYKVKVPVIKMSQCRKEYDKMYMNSSQFCAMAPSHNKDTCQGDSGGPMVDSRNTVVGIISWGVECASPMYPGVYTNIGSFHDFIKEY